MDRLAEPLEEEEHTVEHKLVLGGKDCTPAEEWEGAVVALQDDTDDAAGAAGADVVDVAFAKCPDFRSHNLHKEHSALVEVCQAEVPIGDYKELLVGHGVVVPLLLTTIPNNLVGLAVVAVAPEVEEVAEAYSSALVKMDSCSLTNKIVRVPSRWNQTCQIFSKKSDVARTGTNRLTVIYRLRYNGNVYCEVIS